MNYGTTMQGLKVLYDIDEDEYLRFVHDVPIENLLSPDQQLRQALLSISIPKYIFTNADTRHARRVMKALGIEDCFSGIIDILEMSPFCKPQAGSFRIAMSYAGESQPETVSS